MTVHKIKIAQEDQLTFPIINWTYVNYGLVLGTIQKEKNKTQLLLNSLEACN